MKPQFNKAVTATVLTLFLVTSGLALADPPRINQDNTGDIVQTKAEKLGLFDQLFSFALNFGNVQTSYTPGERAKIRVDATAQKDILKENAKKIVNVYRCHDTGCDNPPPIKSASEDECRAVKEWYPQYDDCWMHNEEAFDLGPNEDPVIQSGETWFWGAEFDVPQEEGQYILVGYIWEGNIKTQVQRRRFVVVEEEAPDRDNDGVRDSIDQCPDTAGGQDNGCPLNPEDNDIDDDGVINDNDECPTQQGPKTNNGCPTDTGNGDSGGDAPNLPVIPIGIAVLGAALIGAWYIFLR